MFMADFGHFAEKVKLAPQIQSMTQYIHHLINFHPSPLLEKAWVLKSNH